MSLINDALRRASHIEKNRAPRDSSQSGMEPTPSVKSSRGSMVLVAVILIALALAGWCFRLWWNSRGEREAARPAAPVAKAVSAPLPPGVSPPPVVLADQPEPAALAARVKPAPVKPEPEPAPAPAPVAVASAAAAPAAVPVPVAVPAPAPVAPVASNPAVAPAAPAGMPNVSNYSQSPWPVELRLNAIFFNKAHPRVLINNAMYTPGEEIQGVRIKMIEKDRVTVEWNGHTRTLMLEGE